MPLRSTTKFKPRQLMERAIAVMQRSVAEQRPDGKPTPVVGAVLIQADGTVEEAYRGELRDGDHAEFTLLERKHRATKLDGAKLFVTLEPCAPGARNPPKLSCAERIVNARIKEVWVGIEDSNPTVAGKGFAFLRDHGVAVRMFDRDLQEAILTANRPFLSWARQQAATGVAEPRSAALSPLEAPVARAGIDDLSVKALKQYGASLQVKAPISSPKFQRILVQQGLLVEHRGALRPTGFGVLLFGKAPRRILNQAGLLARAELPTREATRMEFDQPLVLIPEAVEAWLRETLPLTVDRSSMRRRVDVDLPFPILREAIINALVHRDYSLAGQKCQLVVTSDTIIVKSPGRPVEPITLDQLQSFTAPTKSRNPILHYVFAQLGLAEEQGFGLSSLKREAEAKRLPLPAYSLQGDSLILTIFRSAEGATRDLGAASDRLTADERRGWAILSRRTETTQAQYAAALGVVPRTAQRHLARLVGLGLLRRVGRGPATKYVRA